MEIKYCKNKKCKRLLPAGYKHKYCENCRNEHVKQIKDVGKAVAGVTVFVVGAALKGKINHRK